MTHATIHIYQLSIADYDKLIELWREAGLHSLRPHGRDSREAIEQQLAAGTQTILGLELNEQLIGVVVTTHDGRKGWINRLAVVSSFRRQGYAAMLIKAAQYRLREQGMTVVAALVEGDNAPSYQLFKKIGYVEIDPHIHYLTKRESEAA